MRLGFAVKVLGAGGLPSHDTRRWQSGPHLRTSLDRLEEIQVQAELLDGMGLGPEAEVVLHVGGAAGGVPTGLDRFERGFARLSAAARARVVVENDDRSFGTADVL